MKKLLFSFFLSPFLLFSQVLYKDAQEAFNTQQYKKAFLAFNSVYKKYLDEDAAYYLGQMHEMGLGTDLNHTKADKWYRIAAKRYFDINEDKHNHKYNKQRRFVFSKLNKIEDNDTRETLRELVEAHFEFKAHKPNYFLPFGYQENKYDTYVASDSYKNIEAEFQFSVKFDLASNLLGMNEVYSGAYTQRSFWQIYAYSSPFRESNYNPEVFVRFPILMHRNFTFLKGLTLGVAHQSNGQGSTQTVTSEITGNRSRSWNYSYVTLHLQFNSLIVDLKIWDRYNEDLSSDDNPDLINYFGHGSITFTLPYKKVLFRTMIRKNVSNSYGAIEASFSVPLPKKEDLFFYAKVFSGYGESLIEYNQEITKYSVGVSFSR